MVDVEVCHVEIDENGRECSRGAARITLDPNCSLISQVDAIADEIGIDRTSEELALLAPWHTCYLTAEEWLDGVPEWLADGAPRVLELVPEPSVEVGQVLGMLADNEANGECKKRLAFWMRKRLQLAYWAEEFLTQEGLSALLELADERDTPAARDESAAPQAEGSHAALQGYCLQALRQALCWQAAMAEVRRAASHCCVAAACSRRHHAHAAHAALTRPSRRPGSSARPRRTRTCSSTSYTPTGRASHHAPSSSSSCAAPPPRPSTSTAYAAEPPSRAIAAARPPARLVPLTREPHAHDAGRAHVQNGARRGEGRGAHARREAVQGRRAPPGERRPRCEAERPLALASSTLGSRHSGVAAVARAVRGCTSRRTMRPPDPGLPGPAPWSWTLDAGDIWR